jgi:hypothetical protein
MVQDRAFFNYSPLARQRGATTFELTVVITLFLILVGVVFIGFTAWKHAGLPQNETTIADVLAWKKGANKAACLFNLESIQKAVRGYQKSKKLVTGDPLTVDDLTREGYWTSVPTCPEGGSYSFLNTVPADGVAYATCDIPDHAPSQANLVNW